MITFLILLIILVLLIALAVVILGVGGATFIAIFADLIVCIFIICLIMKWLKKRRNK